MPRVTIRLPSALSAVSAAPRSLEVEAATLAGALDRLVALHPVLATHLYDEQGAFRRHVLCFLDQTNSRWLESLDVPVHDGAVVTILQAVSGG